MTVIRDGNASPTIALVVVAVLVAVGISLRVQTLEAGRRDPDATIQRLEVDHPARSQRAGGLDDATGSSTDSWHADDCRIGTRPDFAH